MDDGAGDYYLDSSDDESGSDSDSDWDVETHKQKIVQLKQQQAVKLKEQQLSETNIRNESQDRVTSHPAQSRGLRHDAALPAIAHLQRRFVRCNSTSTVKVQNTMSKPNQTATIEVIANELHKIISRSEKAPSRVFGTGFDLRRFNDPMLSASACSLEFSDSDSEDEDALVLVEEKMGELDLENFNPNGKPGKAGAIDKPEENRRVPMAARSSVDRRGLLEDMDGFPGCARALPPPPAVRPTAGMIREYLKEMFVTAQCSEECNIICLIYLRRLLECAGNPNGLTAYNWKVAMMTALLLASKVWDDLSMVNEDFSCFLPFSLEQINKWEVEFLQCLKYNVRVKASEYAKVYFDLRKRAQRAGYDSLPEKELDVHQAVKLEALSTTMERRTKQMHSYDSAPARLSNSPLPPRSSAGAGQSPQKRLERSRSDAGPDKPSSCRFIID